MSIGENYFFQQIGEGKSYLDLKDIDWDQLQTDIFGKAGIKVSFLSFSLSFFFFLFFCSNKVFLFSIF